MKMFPTGWGSLEQRDDNDTVRFTNNISHLKKGWQYTEMGWAVLCYCNDYKEIKDINTSSLEASDTVRKKILDVDLLFFYPFNTFN